jgi:hypothetical protein
MINFYMYIFMPKLFYVSTESEIAWDRRMFQGHKPLVAPVPSKL